MTSTPSTLPPSLQASRWIGLGLWLALVACSPTEAQNTPAGPSAESLAQAYHPGNTPRPGSRSECLGRLAFEVPGNALFEWGLPKGSSNEEVLGFSRILRGNRDMILLGNVAVVVIADAKPKTILDMQESVAMDKRWAMRRFDEEINTKNLAAKDLAEQSEIPELKADPKRYAEYREGILRKQEQAREYQLRKQNLDEDWHPTDWGLPGSTGYIAGPTLYAFLLRGNYAFQFMSTGGEHEAPLNERLAAFKSLLGRFEARALYQVPTKPGVCIPHGFIADDGQGHFSADVSYRYTDSPGVIYTLSTGVEGERAYEPNDPVIEATARATVAGLMGNANGKKLKSLGPKSVKIGARDGLMGGIATTEGTPGYSVYAGVNGWAHSHVLPHISLNMRSFDRSTAPDDLKVNPPAFEKSLQRFEQTLGSLRTRKATAGPQ